MAKRRGKPKKGKSKKRKKRRKPRSPTKRVFEKRPRKKAVDDEGPPEGFTINLGEVTQDEAFATIEARLKDAQSRLPEGYTSRIILHPYADGSVDGELYIRLDGEVDDKEAEFDLHDSFTSLSVGSHYWISAGARYQVETDDERYRRNKGMVQTETNYQRATPVNIVEEHLILRHKIMTGMEHRFGEEARDIFIRLHWNPQDEQPKR